MAFPIVPGAGTTPTPVTINNSVLLNGTSQYLSFTPSATSNQTTFTLNVWLKRTSLAGSGIVPVMTANTNNTFFGFDSTSQNPDCLYALTQGTNKYEPISVYRDLAGWYNYHIRVDTTQATSTNRIRTFINGFETPQTYNFQTYPAQNTALDFNTVSVPMLLGSGNSLFLPGYMAYARFVDGQALFPGAFTLFSGSFCIPAAYKGQYGKNGFFLKFENSASLGTDSSGNGNNFTLNGSITAANQYYDSPSHNSCVLNPYDVSATSATLSNGNTTIAGNGGTVVTSFAGVMWQLGKLYYEFTYGGESGSYPEVGFGPLQMPITDDLFSYPGACALRATSGGNYNVIFNNTNYNPTNRPSITIGDVWQFAWDTSTGNLWIGVNNTWLANSSGASGNPSSATNPTLTGILPPMLPAVSTFNSTGTGTFNFGNKGTANFAHTPPTGYASWNTDNLTAPTITNPNNFFWATPFTGNGSSITIGTPFQPDLIFTRSRPSNTNWTWFDSTNGVQKYINSETTAAQVTDTNSLTAFLSNGYTFGSSTNANPSGIPMISYALKAGTTPGFEIVTYTGDGTTNRNISHSLGVAPQFFTVKRLDSASSWFSYFAGFPGTTFFYQLENANAGFTNTNSPWGTGNVTSTEFMVSANGTNNSNATGGSYVAYLFAPIPGFSSIGSYVGNGSVNGPFVNTDFRPAFFYSRALSSGSTFFDSVYDNTRIGYNPNNFVVYLDNTLSNENQNVPSADIFCNGFQLRNTGTYGNTSGQTHFYLAFANRPYNTSNAR